MTEKFLNGLTRREHALFPSNREECVWIVNLAVEQDWGAFKALLSAQEMQRYNNMISVDSARSFLISRAALRLLLSEMLGVTPNSLVIETDSKGKPQLASTTPACAHFNLSHSGDRVVIAGSRIRRVGVDVERWREVPSMLGIAKRYFTHPETELLSAQNEKERERLFFRLWTHKEAALKAVGLGIAGGLHAFGFKLEKDALLLSHLDSRFGEAKDWGFQEICLGPGYTATAAYLPMQKRLNMSSNTSWLKSRPSSRSSAMPACLSSDASNSNG